jgi:oligopeptidase A
MKGIKAMRNPLRHSKQAFGLPEFQSFVPDHVVPALNQLLQDYEKGVEELLAAGATTGWSLVEAETAWADQLSAAWAPVSHLNSVADNQQLRVAFNAGLERLTEHENWRQQHAGIFRAYQDLNASTEYLSLSPEQRRIVDLELRDFILGGADLPPDQQEVYRDLAMRMSKLGARFAENLQDATQAWARHFDTPDALRGLPESELNMLAGIAASREKSGWTVDLSYPSFSAVLTHADDRGLREEVYAAYVTRASDQGPSAGQWDNAPLIAEMLSLRHQLAELLGFESYVEYTLSRRMAETPALILSFLTGLGEKALPAAREQLSRLESFAAGNGAEIPLKAWDIAYWTERYRQVELDLSDEELKPFFPLKRMLAALFHTGGHLFGIRMERDEGVPAWHPDVNFYWLRDETGKRIAGLYMDLYARKDKRGGAWMDICRSRIKTTELEQLPIAFLTCNFSPPTNQQPCLITHRDVQTLFHEFGHCLHHMLTEIDWPQVNGISNVEWDAVELPSQLFESWCWEEEIFARFARHYQTGEQMPKDLKDRLLRSRYFQKAMQLVRQLEYAISDLRLHLEYDPDQPREPEELLQEVRGQYAVIDVPDWNRFLNGFTHIFGGGYAAGYYSYLWAELLAADAWDRFRAEGPFNPEAGHALRDEILAVGASRPAMESFIAFRGRPPEPGPLLESYGLA